MQVQIPEDMFKRWKELRGHGDGVKIKEDNPSMIDNKFNRAFKNGRCDEKTFVALKKFYDKKDKEVKKLFVKQ